MAHEDQLRAGLAKQLKRSDVPDEIWDDLREEGYVAAAQDDEGRADMLAAVKRWYRRGRAFAGQRAPSGRSMEKASPVALSAYERERTLAFSDYVAKRAASTSRVRRFRREVLVDGLLSSDQARAFVTSPALAYFSRSHCQASGIPVVGHTASLVGADDNRSSPSPSRLWVDPPGATFPIPDQPRPVEARAHDAGARAFLAFPGEDGARSLAPFGPGSVLADLHGVAESLERGYPWQAEQAAWFVLTDVVPLVSPLQTRGGWVGTRYWMRSTITLTVEPWVPAGTVSRTYRRLQREALGGDNRPLSARNLALFRFVTDRMDARGDLPLWRELLQAWHVAHPEWRYQDIRTFARDFRRAERAILWPID